MTATPHTTLQTMQPEPSSMQQPQTGTSSGGLGTSLLGRLFATQEPMQPRDDPSETDTSLYDYENARNTTPCVRCAVLCMLPSFLLTCLFFLLLCSYPNVSFFQPNITRAHVELPLALFQRCMSRIGCALVPPAAFAAVPLMPMPLPLPQPFDGSPGLRSGLLTASTLPMQTLATGDLDSEQDYVLASG
jgi:hypothetical protein